VEGDLLMAIGEIRIDDTPPKMHDHDQLLYQTILQTVTATATATSNPKHKNKNSSSTKKPILLLLQHEY